MGITVRTRLGLGFLAVVMLFAFVLLLGVQQAHAQSEMPVYRFYHQASGSHFYTANEAERAYVEANLSHAYTFEGIAYWTAPDWFEAPTAPLHRFYNLRNGSHFYTISEVEKERVRTTLGDTYRYEGVAYEVFTSGFDAPATPVYRFYNLRNGSHFYTGSEAEKTYVRLHYGDIYRYEGVAFYSMSMLFR